MGFRREVLLEMPETLPCPVGDLDWDTLHLHELLLIESNGNGWTAKYAPLTEMFLFSL